MDIRKLQRAIVDGLEDVKAQNIAVFNTEHLSPLFERVIVASGTSNRQTKALAASVRDAVKSRGMDVLRTEGEDNGEWIIVDCGAAVAHIMQPAIRDYYHLEEIWGGKGVRMKMGEAKTTLVKASEPEPPARKAAAKKAAAKKAGAQSPAAKTVAARKVANRTAAGKRVATKSPARKTAAAKTSAARKTPRAR
jgi:ribosome-associated protein